MPEASTGPIRAWDSGNRGFLVECSFGTGEWGACSAWQRALTDKVVQVSRHREQRQGVAGLTGGAGSAVGVSRMKSVIRGGLGTVMSDRPFLNRLGRTCFVVKIRSSACSMGVRSHDFRSGLQLGQRHLGRHRVAHPAAQGQQGDHEGEEYYAHTRMIGYLLGSSGLGLTFRGPQAFDRACICHALVCKISI